ncbi:MAG: beta-ketoacyl-ACP synthase II [Clostridiales bacterium]|jgi:3-oxoacyl-[acyl-carrier-protein] synthase II|nr:beta-ketoacyl-ACP synthase II [Clostridiales bacterium]
MRRVVVTGMGAVSPLGIGAESLWEGVKAGKNGIGAVTKLDVSQMPTKVAGEVKDFDPSRYIDRKELKRMDAYSHYALAASAMALESSGIDLDREDRTRIGVIIGSGIGGIGTFEEQHKIMLAKGPSRVSPFFIPMMIANMAAGNVAIHFGLKGFNECVVTACSSGTNAIGDSFHLIRDGKADAVITGGSEAALTTMAFAGFCAMKAMSPNPDPATASRPFDKNRDGFVLGEGAGILVLEELGHAAKRGAGIIAEIVGYGCTDDAFHVVQPAENGEGAARCMALALDDAGLAPSDRQYINAHGTSTDLNDRYETMAIKTVFGEHARKLGISSTKSMTGHLLGAAGAIEAIITCCALRSGYMPPTIHYETADPDCDLDYVANVGREAGIALALSNSLGFGGHNATLAFRKYAAEGGESQARR